MSNEVTLFKKLAILLFVINLIGLTLAAFLGNNAGIPALNLLNTISAQIQTAAAQIPAALNTTVIGVSANSGWWGVPAAIINDVAALFAFIIAVAYFLLLGVYMLIYALFIFMPALFTSLNIGVLGSILTLAFSLISLVIAAYAFYIVSSIISRIVGVVTTVL